MWLREHPGRLEAITTRVEAITLRLEAIVIRLREHPAGRINSASNSPTSKTDKVYMQRLSWLNVPFQV